MAIKRIGSVKCEIGHKSNASVYNQIKAGVLTRPVAIGARAVGWPDYEIEAIVKARIAGKSDDELRALVEQLHSQRVGG